MNEPHKHRHDALDIFHCCSNNFPCNSVGFARWKMKYLFPVVALVVATAGCTPTGPVFTVPDRAGLGAFLAFEVVANDAGATPVPTPDGAPAGDWCDECTPGGVPLYPSHPGKVGDGTVFNTCPVCGGTQKAPGTVEEEIKQLGDAIDNVPEDWNESTIRDLGDKLADVLEAKEEEQDVPDIVCLNGSAWTFEDKRIKQATNADMVKHLVEVHDIEYESASKMSREELIALHNLLHNTEIRSSAPTADCPSGSCPTSSGSSSSCPSGNCPTSRGSSSSSRRGLFGWRR